MYNIDMLGFISLGIILLILGIVSSHDEEKSRKDIRNGRKFGIKPKDF